MDATQFVEKYRPIYRDLHRFALCMLGNAHDAEDAVLKALQVQEPAKGIGGRSAKPRRIRRTVLAAAACVVLAAGIGAFASIQGNEGRGRSVIPSAEEWRGIMAERTVDGSPAPAARSYQEALACLREAYRRNGIAGAVGSDATAVDAAVADGAVRGSAADSPQTASGTYSSTNIRTENIEEADIVKTDGRYLYVVKAESHAVAVVDTTEGNMAQVGAIDLGGRRTFYELQSLCRVQESEGGHTGSLRSLG